MNPISSTGGATVDVGVVELVDFQWIDNELTESRTVGNSNPTKAGL